MFSCSRRLAHFGDRVFRVGTIRQCHQAHSLREALNIATPSATSPERSRPKSAGNSIEKRDFVAPLRILTSIGLVLVYEHLVIPVFRDGNFLVSQLFWIAV